MKLLLTILSLSISTGLFAQISLNIELFGQYDREDGRASGSWSYTDTNGNEYALLGAQTGTSIVSISNANQIEELAFIPGPHSNWREITVVDDHAFVVTEGSSPDHPGMQIIDLSNLPSSATLVANYNETFTKGHIIQKSIFEETPYIYVCGTSSTDGVHILDITDPENPQQVGLYQPGYYIHDCHVRGDIMFGAAFYEATIDIIDISDKTNPVLITRIQDPGGSTHSFSTSEDGQYLILAHEMDGIPGRVFDISDLENPTQVALYTANYASLVHNPYVRGDFCFVSHNSEGMRVLDIKDPAVPVEVGYYDTFLGPSGGFNGLWSACPYLPSGKIIGGNREDGLYIWTFNNTKAGRFYGQVVDSLTGNPIFNANIELIESATIYTSDSEGVFKGGALAGDYQLEVSYNGYNTKVVPITLSEREDTNLVVELSTIVNHSNEVDTDASIIVFPNPASDLLNVKLNQLSSAHEWVLIDMQGSIVKHQLLRPFTKDLSIRIAGLPSQSYHLLVKDRQGNILDKVMVVVD
ncbi:MAG: choice-of-anchor B family protein [Chitinophagales bacterium]|nr:choice-of-anchor B family protein [Chitinophagales bacterium]